MERSDTWRLFGALLLVLTNGFFVAAEFAIVKIRGTRLQQMIDEGSARARVAQGIQKRLNVYLSATQLGITLCSLALGWIAEPAIAGMLEPHLAGLGGMTEAVSHGIATVVALVAITYFHTVVGELFPKSLAIARAEKVALWTAAPLTVFFRFTYPLIATLNASANFMLKVAGLPPVTGGGEAHSEEELRLIFEASARGGTLPESTRDLLTNVVDYAERVAREVMTPRARVEVLDARKSWDENLKAAIAGEWTRYPIVEGERGKIMGFVHIKDLFRSQMDPASPRDMRLIARQPLIVPESMPLDRLRRRIQSTRTQMALVIDEFGSFVGVVTLEDCLEEIVGEIQDETDQESAPIIRDDASGATEVDGELLLDEMKTELGLEIPDDEREGVDTVGGYVFSRLSRPPVIGDVVELGRHRLVVTGVDGLRVSRLRITEVTPPPGEGTESPPVET